jgi:hypothetical protein
MPLLTIEARLILASKKEEALARHVKNAEELVG